MAFLSLYLYPQDRKNNGAYLPDPRERIIEIMYVKCLA